MILESLASFAIFILELMLNAFSIVAVPMSFLSFLISILEFGAWVLGSSFVALIFGNIFFWLTFRFGAGLILFIYRLIPLT